MINKIYLALGSNKGDKSAFIKNAIAELLSYKSIEISGYSSIYYTKPYGFIEQENFINMVIEIKTSEEIVEFHKITKSIEDKIGRVKTHHWGPREIDLDILLFNEEIIHSENITIPHIEICNRDFFLVPLLELQPDLVHPETKILLSDYLNTLSENYILAKEIFKTN